MKNRQISEQEIAQYARLFLLAHIQLAYMQRQLGAGMNPWQRWRFRSRHRHIQRQLGVLLRLNADDREEAEQAIEEDFKFMRTGKKGWSYISVGEIEYLEGLIKGLE